MFMARRQTVLIQKICTAYYRFLASYCFVHTGEDFTVKKNKHTHARTHHFLNQAIYLTLCAKICCIIPIYSKYIVKYLLLQGFTSGVAYKFKGEF